MQTQVIKNNMRNCVLGKGRLTLKFKSKISNILYQLPQKIHTFNDQKTALYAVIHRDHTVSYVSLSLINVFCKTVIIYLRCFLFILAKFELND